jgi:hypothetical protein
MRFVEQRHRSCPVDVERRAADRREVASLLEADLSLAVAPPGFDDTFVRPPRPAEDVAPEMNVHASLEGEASLRRGGTAGGNDELVRIPLREDGVVREPVT